MFAHHAEKNLANNGFAAAVMDYGPSARDEQIKNAKSDDDGDSDGEVKDGVYEEGTAYGVTKVYLSERCSATGVPHLFFDTHILRKTLWLIALIFCLYRMIVESIAAFEDYLSFPVTVGIAVEDQKEFAFPAVTVCNLNMLSYNKINIVKPSALNNLVEVENKYMRDIRGPAGESKPDNFSGICSIGYQRFQRPSNSSKYWKPEANERLWDVLLNRTEANETGGLMYPYYNPCDLLRPPNCTHPNTSKSDLRCAGRRTTSATSNATAALLGRRKRAAVIAEHLQQLHLAIKDDPGHRDLYQKSVHNALEKLLQEPTHIRQKRQINIQSYLDSISAAANTGVSQVNAAASSGSASINTAVASGTNALNTAASAGSTLINNTIGAGLSAVNNTISSATNAINQTVGAATSLLNQTVSQATGVINNTMSSAISAVNNTVASAAKAINNTISSATSALNNTVSAATGLINNTVSTATTAINSTADAATAAVKKAANAAVAMANDSLSSAGQQVNSMFAAAAKAANATFMDAAKQAADTMAQAMIIANQTIAAAQAQAQAMAKGISPANLSAIAATLTSVMTPMIDQNMLTNALTNPDILGAIKSLKLPVLTNGLLDLLASVVDDYINLGGLLNFLLRPNATEIFKCNDDGTYSLMMYPFADFTKDACSTAEVPCVDFILNDNFGKKNPNNSTEYKKCVKVTQICDGYRDCADGSDEGLLCNHSRQICPMINDTRTNQLGHFVCNKTRACINNLLVCDCNKDCLDNWDEKQNCSAAGEASSWANAANPGTYYSGPYSPPKFGALTMGGISFPTAFDPASKQSYMPSSYMQTGSTAYSYASKGSCYAKMASSAASSGDPDGPFDYTDDNSRFYGLDPYDIEAIIKRSKTGDLSDIQQVVTPTPDLIELFGSRAEDFIMSCSIDGKLCSYKDFYKWQSHAYGNCFTFNSPFLRYQGINGTSNVTEDDFPVYQTFRYGAQNGLKLVLNVETEQYLSSFTPDIGVRVVVHPNNMIPFPEDTGVNIPPGYASSIGIKKKTIQRASYPYGECHGAKWDFNGDYSQMACIKACIETNVRSQCKCMSLISPLFADHNSTHNVNQTYGGLPRCSPTVEAQDVCYNAVWESYTNGSMECHCDPACNEDSYSQTISMSEQNKRFSYMLARIKRYYVAEEFCQDDPSKMSTVRLNVFVESTAQEIIQESPQYSMQDLIANLGGIWGFYLGFSAVTVLELFEYVTYLCGYARKACKKDGEVSPSPSDAWPASNGRSTSAVHPMKNGTSRDNQDLFAPRRPHQHSPPTKRPLPPNPSPPAYQVRPPDFDSTLKRPTYVPPPGVAPDRLSVASETGSVGPRPSSSSPGRSAAPIAAKAHPRVARAVREDAMAAPPMPNEVDDAEDDIDELSPKRGSDGRDNKTDQLPVPGPGKGNKRAPSPGAFLNNPDYDPFDF